MNFNYMSKFVLLKYCTLKEFFKLPIFYYENSVILQYTMVEESNFEPICEN